MKGKKLKQEERLRFEHSKHKQSANDAVSQQHMIQSIEERHSLATERYQNICVKREGQIRKSRY